MIIEVKNSNLIQGVDKSIPVQLSNNAFFANSDKATMKLTQAYDNCSFGTLSTDNGKIILDYEKKLIFFNFEGEETKNWRVVYSSDDYFIRFYGTLYIDDINGASRLFSGQRFKFYMRLGEYYG